MVVGELVNRISAVDEHACSRTKGQAPFWFSEEDAEALFNYCNESIVAFASKTALNLDDDFNLLDVEPFCNFSPTIWLLVSKCLYPHTKQFKDDYFVTEDFEKLLRDRCKDAYWESRSETKAKLKGYLDKLASSIVANEEDATALVKKLESANAMKEELNELKDEKERLGLFQFKLRKELEQQIEEKTSNLQKQTDSLEVANKEFEQKVEAQQAEFQELLDKKRRTLWEKMEVQTVCLRHPRNS